MPQARPRIFSKLGETNETRTEKLCSVNGTVLPEHPSNAAIRTTGDASDCFKSSARFAQNNGVGTYQLTNGNSLTPTVVALRENIQCDERVRHHVAYTNHLDVRDVDNDRHKRGLHRSLAESEPRPPTNNGTVAARWNRDRGPVLMESVG